MNAFSPENLLSIAFLGTFICGFVCLLSPLRHADRLSLALLTFFALMGSVAAGVVAFGGKTALVLPVFVQSLPFFFHMTLGLDRLSAIFFVLINVTAATCALFGLRYLTKHAYLYHARPTGFHFAAALFGFQGILLSTTLIGFLFFLEITALATFFLVMSSRSAPSRSAAFKYFLVMQVSAGALLAGLFMLADGGVLGSFSSLSVIVGTLSPIRLTVASLCLLLGFALRSGLAPFHGWIKSVEEVAPTHVLPLLTLANILVSVYLFLRTVLFPLHGAPVWLSFALIACGLITGALGALLGGVSEKMKEIVSYDTIKNSGVMFALLGTALLAAQLSLSALANATLLALFLLIFSHTFIKAGLLLAAGVVTDETHALSLEGMGGLARRMPRLSVLFAILALAVVGLPPSGAYLSAWAFTEAILQEALVIPVLYGSLFTLTLSALFFTSGLSLFTAVKLFSGAFLGRPCSLGAENASEPANGYLLPILALTLLGSVTGVFSPQIFSVLGVGALIKNAGTFYPAFVFGASSFAPAGFFVIFLLILVLVIAFGLLFASTSKRRMQAPWNGGEPLTPRMEYSATAFASPLRYFFRFFLALRPRRVMTVTALVTTNPWFTSKAFRHEAEPAWHKALAPSFWKAQKVLSGVLFGLQTGNVQVYVAMMLLTLTACILFAL